MKWLVKFWKREAIPPKEFRILYGWASPKIPNLASAPYIYVFKITCLDGNAIDAGLRSGARLRKYVLKNLVFPTASGGIGATCRENIGIWNEIIPSSKRHPTHRIELGVLRKKSGIPRSALFSEYFCFTPINNKTSDRVAIQIAGFVASELEKVQSFDGARIRDNRAYWLLCVFSAWKQFGR